MLLWFVGQTLPNERERSPFPFSTSPFIHFAVNFRFRQFFRFIWHFFYRIFKFFVCVLWTTTAVRISALLLPPLSFYILIYFFAFFHFVYAVKKLRDASASSCLFMICSCCHMQSFTDATPTRLPPIAWNCLLLLLLLRILVCWFFICIRLLYFFGIALGMFDMISGIALVNLTKEKKWESCRRCCCWVLSL